MATRRQQKVTPFGLFLIRHGITHRAAADSLGCTRAYVQMLATGDATPHLAFAGRIKAWSERISRHRPILMESWLPFCRKAV